MMNDDIVLLLDESMNLAISGIAQDLCGKSAMAPIPAPPFPFIRLFETPSSPHGAAAQQLHAAAAAVCRERQASPLTGRLLRWAIEHGELRLYGRPRVGHRGGACRARARALGLIGRRTRCLSLLTSCGSSVPSDANSRRIDSCRRKRSAVLMEPFRRTSEIRLVTPCMTELLRRCSGLGCKPGSAVLALPSA